MFNVYGDGVFLETVNDNSPATLAEFAALGYANVEARPMGDLIQGDGAKEAESFFMPPPPAEIVWPDGFDNPEQWEKQISEQSAREAEKEKREAEEQAALLKSFQDEVEEDEKESGHFMEGAEGKKAFHEKSKKEQGE